MTVTMTATTIQCAEAFLLPSTIIPRFTGTNHVASTSIQRSVQAPPIPTYIRPIGYSDFHLVEPSGKNGPVSRQQNDGRRTLGQHKAATRQSTPRRWEGPFPKIQTSLSHGFEDTLATLLEEEGESVFLGTKDKTPTNWNGDQETDDGSAPICRVVALADSKLPNPSPDNMPPFLFQSPQFLLRRLSDIYHAIAHDETQGLNYVDRASTSSEMSSSTQAPTVQQYLDEQKDLVRITRTCLEDAGFELLTRRDLDLCEALNAGYLLRLSIVPDVSELDEGIVQEFYPELFSNSSTSDSDESDFLFDGRVLVYRRGYSQEVTQGRLLLPKLDYLQTSLVQRSTSWLKLQLDTLEEAVMDRMKAVSNRFRRSVAQGARKAIDKLPQSYIRTLVQEQLTPSLDAVVSPPINGLSTLGLRRGLPQLQSHREQGSFFRLTRYGGSKIRFVGSSNPIDALEPFLICQSREGSFCAPCPMNKRKRGRQQKEDNCDDCESRCEDYNLKCPYDVGILGPDLSHPSMQLLERVTIGNLVNIFSRDGRRKLLRTLASESELVEPTYEEVVVVWRPKARKDRSTRPRVSPPKVMYELADMFDLQGLPPKQVEEDKKVIPRPLEIRTFEQVPMANLPAVLPKTKLVFRPADALVFDLVSIVSFLLVIGSQRFDSPKLDLLALVSVSLWVLRTVLRYSNKLARYDLLVKTFLTSKISHRNAGALKYLATEAGSQRATRAALVYEWLRGRLARGRARNENRDVLIRDGRGAISKMLSNAEREIPIDIDAALNDLQDLKLVEVINDGGTIQVEKDDHKLVRKLKLAWDDIFDRHMSLDAMIGRRRGRAPAVQDPDVLL